MEPELRKSLVNIGKAVKVADNVAGPSSTFSSPSSSSSKITNVEAGVYSMNLSGTDLRNRSGPTPTNLKSISRDIGDLLSQHQIFSTAKELTSDVIQKAQLQQGMDSVKTVFETVKKADNVQQARAKGIKQVPKTYSPKFVYALVPLLPNGVPAEEFKVGRTNASFDELLDFCKEFNLRYGTYITHYFVELFEVKYEATTAEIEKLILRLRDIESPVEKGYFPFAKNDGRGVNDITHDELREYLLQRIVRKPTPTVDYTTSAFIDGSFTGFTMVPFISTFFFCSLTFIDLRCMRIRKTNGLQCSIKIGGFSFLFSLML